MNNKINEKYLEWNKDDQMERNCVDEKIHN